MKNNVLVFGVSDSEIPKYLEKVSETINLTIITNDSIHQNLSKNETVFSGMLLLDDTSKVDNYNYIYTNSYNFTELQSQLNTILNNNRPVLAIGQGMYFLNDLFNKNAKQIYDEIKTSDDLLDIFISPGSKTAAIIGSGGFFKIPNSVPQSMKEFQRSKDLITSVYELGTGYVHGIESTLHDWVLGYQFNPFIDGPSIVRALIDGFIERAVQ